MADAVLSVYDTTGAVQLIDNESVVTGLGTVLRQRGSNPESDALLTTISNTLTAGLGVHTSDSTASGNITTQNLNPTSGVPTASSTVTITGLNGQSTLTIHPTGTYTGALTVQGTVDGSNWVAIEVTNALVSGTGVVAATITSASTSLWQANIAGFNAVRVTALAAVTGTAVVNLRASIGDMFGKTINIAQWGGGAVSNAGVTGVVAMGGKEAHSAAAATNPVQTGGRVITTLDTTLTQGDACYANFTTAGQMVTKEFGSAENDWQASSGTTPLATTTSTALKAAGAASIRNYLTGLQLFNTSTTVGTTVSILDGSTVIWTGYLPAVPTGTQVMPLVVQFATPLKGSAATAMNIQLGTTTASVYYNAQGYQSF